MRTIIYGAGAIGGAVGGRLHQAGHDVTLIARGHHLKVMRDQGLRIDSPDGSITSNPAVAASPEELDLGDGDVVMLAMKGQDTAGALDDLRRAAPTTISIVCLQNGVENERAALRLFPHVYAVPVMCPASHAEPGVVEVWSTPVAGILDIGRYPEGNDHIAQEISAAFTEAGFSSEVRDDIMRWKWRKLLMNLLNAAEAVCGRAAWESELPQLLQAEGEACLRAAGIEAASEEEDRARRGDLLSMHPIGGRRRQGGSSWQSLERRRGSIETDHLNGEIVLLGRLHGVPTPANALLQRLANELAHAGAPPASLTPEEVLAQLGR